MLQSFPLKPAKHRQVYEFPETIQTPLFLQGLLEHTPDVALKK